MTQPNFVFIMTDTQATNMIGAYGHPDLQTNHIDALARQGIRFERAYSCCPVCTPARAAIFTGIYPHTSGPWANNLSMGDNIKTMGQRFQDAGYRTAYIGKWHLDAHDYFGTGICPPGWEDEYWYDGARYLAELTPEEIALWRRGLTTVNALRKHNIQPEFTWANRVSNRAVDFLTKHDSNKPYLLVVSYDEPHHPFTCPPEYAERFENYEYPLGPAAFDTLENKPPHQQEWAQSTVLPPIKDGKVRHPLYFGCNAYVDTEIGRVIDAVHQYSPENTYIIFTSDHGEMLGAHGLTGKGACMYDEITRIPLIIEQPHGMGAGEVCPEVVSHIDLLPTMLELAGITPAPILEGRTLVPLLEGRHESDRTAVIEFNRYEIEHDSFGGYQPVRCLMDGRYKLVINLLSTDELYDLQEDPAEVVNLIHSPDHIDIRNGLHDQLLDWMYTKRDPMRGYYWERRPWRESRRLQWRGLFRPRPADGYAPQVRDYDTGMPTLGVKTEHGLEKK